MHISCVRLGKKCFLELRDGLAPSLDFIVSRPDVYLGTHEFAVKCIDLVFKLLTKEFIFGHLLAEIVVLIEDLTGSCPRHESLLEVALLKAEFTFGLSDFELILDLQLLEFLDVGGPRLHKILLQLSNLLVQILLFIPVFLRLGQLLAEDFVGPLSFNSCL